MPSGRAKLYGKMHQNGFFEFMNSVPHKGNV